MRRGVAELASRTPPEGLTAWKPVRDGLETSGLVYEAVWTEDWSPLQILGEWSEPKKTKMVEVCCSCCGEARLLPWAKTTPERGGYGFVEPDDFPYADVGFSPVGSGDETHCPLCGVPVKVRKAAEFRRGYFVTDETRVMSASVCGEEKNLVLTGWHIQRRVSRSGGEWLKVLPAEAYIFGPQDCAKLTGWRNSYSGTAGYFVSYSSSWREPKKWRDTWGTAGEIYGLTPELIAESCLPDCKLDVYMETFQGINQKFPIAYLRLYQAHPNVENLLLNGLPLVLDDLLAKSRNLLGQKTRSKDAPQLEGIRWDEVRPARMLGLTREELRLAQSQCWGAFLWRLFTGAKAQGERLTGEDIQNAFSLGDEAALDLIGQGPVGKSLRYLMQQAEQAGPGTENEYGDPIPETAVDATMLLDYWRVSGELGRDVDDPQVRWPRDLPAAHDAVMAAARDKTAVVQKRTMAARFRIRRRQLARYIFEADGLKIVPAYSQRELEQEADALHHCVWTYAQRHADGTTAIFFIRRTVDAKTPYYTLELDEKSLTVRQNRGLRNCGKTPEVQDFENLWITWVRAGAKRDLDGNPILPEKRPAERTA